MRAIPAVRFKFSMTRNDFNASVSVLGIMALGIFAIWFPISILRVPLPEGMLAGPAVTTLWQTMTTVVFPFWWANRRLGMSFADLGLTTRNLARSTALGCAVYVIALVSFLHCSGGSLMQNHVIRSAQLTDASAILGVLCVIAAGTDLAARGYLLLTLTRHSHVFFAILMQNVLWYLGHREEINLLVDCLGVSLATTLTLTLGILGDIVVLRTGNVVGLAIAHILLNVILGAYLRFL